MDKRHFLQKAGNQFVFFFSFLFFMQSSQPAPTKINAKANQKLKIDLLMQSYWCFNVMENVLAGNQLMRILYPNIFNPSTPIVDAIN